MTRAALAVLLLSVIANADVMPGDRVRLQQTDSGLSYTITEGADLNILRIVGTFDHGENVDFLGVVLPADFVFSMEYDPEAADENPDPFLGQYETEGARVMLDVGGLHFETTTSEIRIYVNSGFTFGSHDPWIQHGLLHAEYDGDYVSFRGGFNANVAPDDSLLWLSDESQQEEVAHVAYYRHTGNVVPEIQPGLLFALGCVVAMGLQRTRFS
jgi:hypothetical protein